MGNGGKQVIWTRCTPKPANADDARLLRDQVYTCLHGGQPMLMMRGLCGTRFTRKPADADDARFPRDQFYTEAS